MSRIAFVVLATLGLAAFAPDTSPAEGPRARASVSTLSAERLIRQCANRARRMVALPDLIADPALGRAARPHARNMVRWGFVDHDDPLRRGPSERVAIFDRVGFFVGIGENIAAGDPTVRTACQSWNASKGHAASMVDPDFTHNGTGYARGGRYGTYFVQVFGIATAEAP